MPKIDVSVGELFDKLSILEIKKAKGLDVDVELNKLSNANQEYNTEISRYLFTQLKELNSSLESLGRLLAALSYRFVEDYLPLTEKLKEVVEFCKILIEPPADVPPVNAGRCT